MRKYLGIACGQTVSCACISAHELARASTHGYAKLSDWWLNRAQSRLVMSRLFAAFAHQKYPDFQIEYATYTHSPQDL